METLSIRKRKLYFYGLCALFVILIPVVLLYADGYRIGKDWKISETGGIRIAASEAGATFSVDGTVEKQDTFLASTFFLQNLDPKEYDVRVAKDGFIPWEKRIAVGKQLVAEAYALLIPANIAAAPVAPSDPDFAMAERLFARANAAALTAEERAASPEIPADALLRDSVAFWKDGRNIIAAWLGDQDEIPYFFCADECRPAVAAAVAGSAVSSVDFYPSRNDAIIFSTAKGVFAVQIDQRAPRPILPVYSGTVSSAGERVARDGSLYVSKPDGTYLRITLP